MSILKYAQQQKKKKINKDNKNIKKDKINKKNKNIKKDNIETELINIDPLFIPHIPTINLLTILKPKFPFILYIHNPLSNLFIIEVEPTKQVLKNIDLLKSIILAEISLLLKNVAVTRDFLVFKNGNQYFKVMVYYKDSLVSDSKGGKLSEFNRIRTSKINDSHKDAGDLKDSHNDMGDLKQNFHKKMNNFSLQSDHKKKAILFLSKLLKSHGYSSCESEMMKIKCENDFLKNVKNILKRFVSCEIEFDNEDDYLNLNRKNKDLNDKENKDLNDKEKENKNKIINNRFRELLKKIIFYLSKPINLKNLYIPSIKDYDYILFYEKNKNFINKFIKINENKNYIKNKMILFNDSKFLKYLNKFAFVFFCDYHEIVMVKGESDLVFNLLMLKGKFNYLMVNDGE